MQYYDADSHVSRLLEQYEAIMLRPEQVRELARRERKYDELQRANVFRENPETLSAWEELDYRRLIFQQVLDEEQFREFDVGHQQQAVALMSENRKKDSYFVPHVKHLEALLSFATTSFLPKARSLCAYAGAVAGYQIAFLREAYKDFLAQRHMRAVANHLRENRSHAPAGFRALNLEYDLEHCVPAFIDGFLNSSLGVREVATGTVLRTVSMRIKEHELIDLFRSYQDFASESMAAAQDTVERSGWHLTINTPQKTEAERWKELALRVMLAQAAPAAATQNEQA